MEDYKVVKANSLVNMKTLYSYSEMEKKLICSIIAKVLPSDEDFKDYEIPLQDLGLSFVESKNYSKYTKLEKKWDKLTIEKARKEKDIFGSIMSKPLTLENGAYVNWFSYIRLNQETKMIECRFDKALKPYLIALNKSFTEYYLKNIMSLRSSYAIDVYELCKQFMPDPKKNEENEEVLVVNKAFRTINFEEFRELLHIPGSYKTNDITRLLERACKDIQENTNLFVQFKMQKKGRKFSSIRFDIERKTHRETRLLNQITKQKKEKKVSAATKVEKAQTLDEYEEKMQTYQELDFEDYQEQKAKENFVKIHKNQTSIDDYLNEINEEL